MRREPSIVAPALVALVAQPSAEANRRYLESQSQSRIDPFSPLRHPRNQAWQVIFLQSALRECACIVIHQYDMLAQTMLSDLQCTADRTPD